MQRNEGVISVEDASKMLHDCFNDKGWGVVDGETSDFMFECTVSQRNMALRVWFNADKQQYGFDMKKGGSRSAKTPEALTGVLESYLYLNTYLFPVAKKITTAISEQEDISPTYSKVEENDGIYTAVFKILGTTAVMGVRDNGNGDFYVEVSDEGGNIISEYFYKVSEADGSFSIEEVSDEASEEVENVEEASEEAEGDVEASEESEEIEEASEEVEETPEEAVEEDDFEDLDEDALEEDDASEDGLEDDSEVAEPDDFDDEFEKEVASPDSERSIIERLCDDCSDFVRVEDNTISVEKDDLFLTLDTTDEEDALCVLYAVCSEITFEVIDKYPIEQDTSLAVVIDSIENSLRRAVALLEELSSIYGVSYDAGELTTKDGNTIGSYKVTDGVLIIDSVIGKVEIINKENYYDFASRLNEYFENEEDESVAEEVVEEKISDEVESDGVTEGTVADAKVIEVDVSDEAPVESDEEDSEETGLEEDISEEDDSEEDASEEVASGEAKDTGVAPAVEDSEYYVTKLMENGKLVAIRFVDSSNIWDADVEVAVEAGMLLGRIMRTSQRYIKNGMFISDEEDKMEMFSQIVDNVDEAAKLVKRLFA